MRTSVLGAAVVALLAACSSDKTAAPSANAIIATGFEDIDGWVPASASLTKEKAHSGRYSIKVDPTMEYSLTYINGLGKVMASRPKKLHLTGWVTTASKDADAMLSVSIMNAKDGTTLGIEQARVSEKVKEPGTWEKIERDIVIPEKATADDELRLYLWRTGNGEPVYLDDVELQVAE